MPRELPPIDQKQNNAEQPQQNFSPETEMDKKSSSQEKEQKSGNEDAQEQKEETRNHQNEYTELQSEERRLKREFSQIAFIDFLSKEGLQQLFDIYGAKKVTETLTESMKSGNRDLYHVICTLEPDRDKRLKLYDQMERLAQNVVAMEEIREQEITEKEGHHAYLDQRGGYGRITPNSEPLIIKTLNTYRGADNLLNHLGRNLQEKVRNLLFPKRQVERTIKEGEMNEPRVPSLGFDAFHYPNLENNFIEKLHQSTGDIPELLGKQKQQLQQGERHLREQKTEFINRLYQEIGKIRDSIAEESLRRQIQLNEEINELITNKENVSASGKSEETKEVLEKVLQEAINTLEVKLHEIRADAERKFDSATQEFRKILSEYER